MSIKVLNTVAGESIKTVATVPNESVKNVLGIPGAGQPAGGDDFVNTCQDTGALAALWTCQDQNTGELVDGATVMTDQSDNERPNLIAALDATGDWQIEDSSPAGTLASLAKYVSSDANAQGNDNFAALEDVYSAPVSPGEAYSGFIIFYSPSLYSLTEIATFFGTTGTPAGTAGGLSFINFSHYLFGSGTWGGYTNTSTLFSIPMGPTADVTGTWWFLAFRNDGSDVTFYIQQVGSSWSTSTTGTTGSSSDNLLLQTGLRLGYGTGGSSPADIRWCAVGIFTDDIGIGTEGSTLRTIFEVINDNQ